MTEYSFWLCPAKAVEDKLRPVIQRLTKIYQAVEFSPHVTISCGVSSDAEVIDIGRRAAASFKPFELCFEKLDSSALYTKSFFIQFAPSGHADDMNRFIQQNSSQPSSYALNPHLSLMYKDVDASVREQLCQTVALQTGTYLFDRICVIETEIPLTRPEQIKRWRTVFESTLRA